MLISKKISKKKKYRKDQKTNINKNEGTLSSESS